MLTYVIPIAALDHQSVRILAQWYEDISVYRFPDEGGLYERFHQIVVVGRRLSSRDRRRYPEGLLKTLADQHWSSGAAEYVREHVPELSECPGPLAIPTTRQHAELYRASWSLEEIGTRIEADGVGLSLIHI